MQQPINIEIGLLESVVGLSIILLSAGIAWGKLKESVNKIQETLKEDIKPEVKKISTLESRVDALWTRVDALWKDSLAPAGSPRQLNQRGVDVLHQSGIKRIIDDKKEKLLELVKKAGSKNAYDAEKEIESVVFSLPAHCPDVINDLKQGAFMTGSEIGAVLFVGSIYLRDLIFKDLGFSLDELDRESEGVEVDE